jgi:hypothetical protein
MLLNHARIDMTQLRRNHGKRHGAHGEAAGVGVTQRMEVGRRFDPSRLTGSDKAALLIGRAPSAPIGPNEQQCTGGLPSGNSGDEVATLFGPCHPRRAALRENGILTKSPKPA